MKKKIKGFLVILVFISIVLLLRNVSEAWDAEASITAADTWGASVTSDGGIKSSTQKIVGTIIDVIRIVGTGIAIIMITYVAIKYMSAAPSEKAEFKKSATAMIVGAIVLFAATNILKIIANFANTNIG